MNTERWSAEELSDSVGARGLEAMVAVLVRKEGLLEPEARRLAAAHFEACHLDPETGAQRLSPEEARDRAAELNAVAEKARKGMAE